MNEEALNDAYGLFQSTGYNGSLDDFKSLLATNPEAVGDAHKLFVNTGYNGTVEDFSKLVVPTVAKNAPVAVDKPLTGDKPPVVKKKDATDLSGGDTFLASQEKAPDFKNPFTIEKNTVAPIDNKVVEPITPQDPNNDPTKVNFLDVIASNILRSPANMNVEIPTGISSLRDLSNKFGSGAATIGAGIAGIPNYLTKLTAAGILSLDKETSDKMNSLPEGARELILSGADLTGRTAASASAQNFLTEQAERIAENTLKYEGNIVDDIADGNIGQASYRVIQSLTESLPSMAVAMLPGGLALVGAGTASQKQEEQDRAGADLNLKTTLNSGINGIAEAYFEKYTVNMLKPFGDLVRGNKELAKEISENLVKTILKDFGTEGVSEGLTALTQGLSDKFVAGVDVSGWQIAKDVFDATLIGGVMGGGSGILKGMTSYVATKTRDEEVTKKMDSNAEQVQRLKKEIGDTPSEEVKKALQAKVAELDADTVKMHQEEMAKAETLNPEEVKSVFEIDKKMKEVNNKLIEFENDDTISQETKALMRESLQKEFDVLKADKKAIVDNQKVITPEKIEAKKEEIKQRDAKELVSVSDADATKQAVKELSEDPQGVITPEAITKRAAEIKQEAATVERSDADLYKQAVKELTDQVNEPAVEEAKPVEETKPVEEKLPEIAQGTITPEKIEAKKEEIRLRDAKERVVISDVDATKQATKELSENPQGIITPEAIKARAEEIKTEAATAEKSEVDLYKQAVKELTDQVTEGVTVEAPTVEVEVEKTDPVDVAGAPKGSHINVGMVEGKTNKPLTEQEITDKLPKDVKVVGSKIEVVESEGGTESTLALELSRPLTDSEMNAFLKDTKQEAIPQLTDGKGTMFGTKDWGDFNPEFFATTKGNLKAVIEGKGKVRGQVANAVKAIAKLFPKVNVIIHDTQESYNKAMGEKDNSSGTYVPKKESGGDIHINLSRSTPTTVAHEVFHAVIIETFKNKGLGTKTAVALSKATGDMLSSVKRAVGKNSKMFKEIEALEKKVKKGYDDKTIFDEETLAELTGILANNYEALTVPQRGIIKQWLDKIDRIISKALGIHTFESYRKDDTDILDLLKVIAKKTNEGNEITSEDLKALEETSIELTEEIDTEAKPKKPSILVDRKSIHKVERHPNLKENIKENTPLSFFKGKTMHLTFSDRLVTGFINGVEYLGGVFYPAITGGFWAANSSGAASKLMNAVIKNEDGYSYMAIAVMKEDSHMSNKNMSILAIKDVEEQLLGKKIPFDEAYTRIKKAFNTKPLEKFKNEFNDKKHKDVKSLINIIEDTLLSNIATFVERKAFLESLLGKADLNKSLRFGNIQSYNELAKSLQEPITSNMEIGDVNIIIRTKGDLSVKETKEGDKEYHPSYSHAIVSSSDVELYVLDNVYDAVDLFPKISKKGISIEDYKQKYRDQWRFRYLNYIGLGKMSTSISDEIQTEVPIAKRKQISAKNSDNYDNLTEDGKGNVVLYHVSGGKLDDISPSKFGSNKQAPTSKEEAAAWAKVGGVSMYYTKQTDAETQVTGAYKYMVKVPMDKVYDFNTDINNYYDEAKKRHSEEHPGKAFDNNTSLAYITKIAGENGYDVVVSKWDGRTRAQSVTALKPTDSQIRSGNVITKPFKESYEPNKGADTSDKASPLVAVYDKITKAVGNDFGSKLYNLTAKAKYSFDDKYAQFNSQSEITNAILDSNIPDTLKKEYLETLETPQISARKQKGDITDQVQSAREAGISEKSVREYLTKKGFDKKTIDLAITKAFIRSVDSKTKNKENLTQSAVGLRQAVERIRIAYNQGAKDTNAALKIIKKEATTMIFDSLRGKVNINQMKSLVTKVRDINKKNYEAKLTEIDELLTKIARSNQNTAEISAMAKVIANIKKLNNKGKFSVEGIPDLRVMLSAITSLKPKEIPAELRARITRVLGSMNNYNKKMAQPLFDEVSEIYEDLQDTFMDKAYLEELDAEQKIDNLEESLAIKEEKEAEALDFWSNAIKDIMAIGYDKDAFDNFDRALLFKLHKLLGASNLEGYSSRDLRNIAQQLKQTSVGENAWMPTQKISEIVDRLQAEVDVKGMEKESFSQKVSDLSKKPLPLKEKQVAKEVRRYDTVLKGYMSSFSNLFKSGAISYARTVGLIVSAGATADARRSSFAKTFDDLLRKVKGNQFEVQTIMALYALQKRKEGNTNNKNIFSAKEHKDAVAVVNREELDNIFDKFANSDGEFDVAKAEKWMNSDSNKVALWDFIQIELSRANERRKTSAKHYEGIYAEDIDWYTPVVATKGRLSELLSVEGKQQTGIGSSNKSLKATKASPFNFNYFKNIKGHVDNSIEYSQMMPVLKQLEATEKAMTKSSVKTVREDWSRILFGVDNTSGIIQRHFEAKNTLKEKRSLGQEFFNILANNKIKSLLLSAFPRGVVDFGANAFFTYSAYMPEILKGVNNRKKYNTGKSSILTENRWMAEIFANYNSAQAGRDTGVNTSDVRGAQQNRETMHAYTNNKRTVMQYVADLLGHNMINRATSKGLEMYYSITDSPSMKIWKAEFSRLFPTFDVGAFTGAGNLDYREKYDAEIKAAIAGADKLTMNLYNTPASDAEKNSTLINKRSGTIGQAKELLLGFQYNEHHGLWNAIHSMLPSFIDKKGDLTFDQAARNAFIITGRALTYTATQTILANALIQALVGGDDELDDELIAKRALAQYGSLLFWGNQNAFAVMAYQAAFELARTTFFDGTKDDSLFYTKEPGLGNMGLAGMVVEDLLDTSIEISNLFLEEETKLGLDSSMSEEVKKQKVYTYIDAKKRKELDDQISKQKILGEILALSFGIKYNLPIKVVKAKVEKQEKRLDLIKGVSK